LLDLRLIIISNTATGTRFKATARDAIIMPRRQDDATWTTRCRSRSRDGQRQRWEGWVAGHSATKNIVSRATFENSFSHFFLWVKLNFVTPFGKCSSCSLFHSFTAEQ